MELNQEKFSFKDAIINDWKDTWNNREKKLKFIIDTSRLIIFSTVTLIWLFYVFTPADSLVSEYNKSINPNHLLSFWAALGPILPIVLYYFIGEYWVGRGIVELVKRLDI